MASPFSPTSQANMGGKRVPRVEIIFHGIQRVRFPTLEDYHLYIACAVIVEERRKLSAKASQAGAGVPPPTSPLLDLLASHTRTSGTPQAHNTTNFAVPHPLNERGIGANPTSSTMDRIAQPFNVDGMPTMSSNTIGHSTMPRGGLPTAPREEDNPPMYESNALDTLDSRGVGRASVGGLQGKVKTIRRSHRIEATRGKNKPKSRSTRRSTRRG